MILPLLWSEASIFTTAMPVETAKIIIAVPFMLITEMFIMYIIQLQSRVNSKNSENFNLMNGMREGVLVLARKSDDTATPNFSIAFQNKAACKIMKADDKGSLQD